MKQSLKVLVELDKTMHGTAGAIAKFITEEKARIDSEYVRALEALAESDEVRPRVNQLLGERRYITDLFNKFCGG